MGKPPTRFRVSAELAQLVRGLHPDIKRKVRASLDRLALDALPGLDRWSAAERRALVRVVRAKGQRRENEYARLFDAHPRLTAAVLALGRRSPRMR